MHSNVHVTLHKPFPHPSCLVEHLEFTDYKLVPTKTHLTIKHTFQENRSPPNRIQMHKSMDQRIPLVTSHANIFTDRGDNRRDALQTKNKISVTNLKGTVCNKDKGRWEKKVVDLQETILAMKNKHNNQVESLQEQIRNNEMEIGRLRDYQLKAQSRKYQQQNSVFTQSLESIEDKYRTETEKSGSQRIHLTELRKRLFQLEGDNQNLTQEIQELRQVIQLERSMYSHTLPPIQRELHGLKAQLRPHHLNCIAVCEIYLEIADIIDKLREREPPLQFYCIKQSLQVNRGIVSEVMQKLQSLCGDISRNRDRCQIKRKYNSIQVKAQTQDKSGNEWDKCLKTCTDSEGTGMDNSLYQMLLIQADIIEKTL